MILYVVHFFSLYGCIFLLFYEFWFENEIRMKIAVFDMISCIILQSVVHIIGFRLGNDGILVGVVVMGGF